MKKSLNNIRYQGVDEILLLTGDIEDQASIVASKVGVDGYEAELLPEDKAKTILKLQSKNSKVIMVGDGINDAPALAYACLLYTSFLIVASILNVILDLIFIINFNMGVAGAAYATNIAQGVSAVLCFIYSYKKFKILRLRCV